MKTLFYPALIFVAVLGVILVGSNILWNTISDQNNVLSKNQETEKMLKTKLSLLQTVGSQVTVDSQAVVAALPATSPVLYVMHNVRSIAQVYGLKLNNFTSGEVSNPTKSTLLSGEIIFEVEGEYSNLVFFMTKIKASAPLVRFDGIKVLNQNSQGPGDYKLSGDMFTYWSALPTTIPSVNQPSNGLTSDEQELLAKMAALAPPTLASGSSVTTTAGGRSDPFSL